MEECDSTSPRKGCFKYGDISRLKKECPLLLRRSPQQSTQLMVSAPVGIPLTQPTRDWAQSDRGRPRGGDQSVGGHGRCYEFLARPEEVTSDVVIRDMPRDSLGISFHVSIPLDDSIVMDRVYRSCVVTNWGYEPRVDRFLLTFMRDFSVDTPTVEWVPVLRDFSDVFHVDLSASGCYGILKGYLRSKYHQLKIRALEIAKTALTNRYKQHEFMVLSFGLTNAPTTYIHLMKNVFQPYLHSFFIMFIDDILVYSCKRERHDQHMRIVLQLLSGEDVRC
nr:uncharacterized protein LOC104093232 [Nicotiana tomentosiformis]